MLRRPGWPTLGAMDTDVETTEVRLGFDHTSDSDHFTPDADGRMEERVLGLGEASGGQVRARHLRARGDAVGHVRTCASDGHEVLYVRRGSASLDLGGGTDEPVAAGTAVYLPAGREYRILDRSYDFEAVVLTADDPAPGRTHEPSVDRETETSYVVGGTGREYLSFRHLAVADRTDRRFEVSLIRGLASPAGGTGWHSHDNSEWVFVLSGAAELRMAGRPSLTLRSGDSLTIPPGTVHAVPGFSVDYSRISVNLPADFRTEAAAAPRD